MSQHLRTSFLPAAQKNSTHICSPVIGIHACVLSFAVGYLSHLTDPCLNVLQYRIDQFDLFFAEFL